MTIRPGFAFAERGAPVLRQVARKVRENRAPCFRWYCKPSRGNPSHTRGTERTRGDTKIEAPLFVLISKLEERVTADLPHAPSGKRGEGGHANTKAAET